MRRFTQASLNCCQPWRRYTAASNTGFGTAFIVCGRPGRRIEPALPSTFAPERSGKRSFWLVALAVRLDRRLLQRIDPSDIIQETLILADRRLDKYLKDQPIPFYPWLRQL